MACPTNVTTECTRKNRMGFTKILMTHLWGRHCREAWQGLLACYTGQKWRSKHEYRTWAPGWDELTALGGNAARRTTSAAMYTPCFHINTPPNSIKHTSPSASSKSEVLHAQFTTRDLAPSPLRAQPRSELHKSFLPTLNGWHNLCKFGELQRRCEVSMWRTSQKFLWDCGFLQFWNLVVFQMEEIMLFSTWSFFGRTTSSIISTSLINYHMAQETHCLECSKLIHSPHLLVRATGERFLPARGHFY